jgi:hypothetical protein
MLYLPSMLMVEKQPKDNNTNHTPTTINKALESQLRSLHGAFLDRNASKSQDELTADKFVEYVGSQSNGKHLLSAINNTTVKVFFDHIQQQGTSLKTITTHSNYFRE